MTTIKELAEKTFPEHVNAATCFRNRDKRFGYIIGANAIIESVKEELIRAFLNDFEGFSEHDREIAQGVLGEIQMF